MAKQSQFKPGQSGNPKGRPKGSRHKATIAVLELLDGEAEALSRKAVELALDGDTTALRLCQERIAPPRKDAPVLFSLPEMKNASDALTAINSIVQAVSNGDLTPGEATSMTGLIETFRKSAETEDLERRIARLESRK
jgi:hypothetical protein